LIGWRSHRQYWAPEILAHEIEGLRRAGVPDEAEQARQRWLNHSCDPNVEFDENFNFTTIREIFPGESVVFDYLTTEERIVPFRCFCGSADCVGNISGFGDLQLHQKLRRAARLSPHMKIKYADLL